MFLWVCLKNVGLLRGGPWTSVGSDTESGAPFSSYLFSEVPPHSHTHGLFAWCSGQKHRASLQRTPSISVTEKKKKPNKDPAHYSDHKGTFFLVPLGWSFHLPCHAVQFKAMREKKKNWKTQSPLCQFSSVSLYSPTLLFLFTSKYLPCILPKDFLL